NMNHNDKDNFTSDNKENDFSLDIKTNNVSNEGTIIIEPTTEHKKHKIRAKPLPVLGIVAMLLIASILGGVVGGVTQYYISSNNQPQGITKENNLKQGVPGAILQKNSITKVAEDVGPAIVGISITKNSWLEATSDESSGSGIVFDSNGYIVTNQHVIAGGTKIMISLPNGKKVPAKVIGQDAKTDLAVLKVEEKGLTAAKFGNSDGLRVGDTVIAIGNPLGEEFAGSVTSGIVSAKGRNMSINQDGYSRTYNGIQTDASINPGNSGGALLNEVGEVIGINTLKIKSAEGMGFAIPINEVKLVTKELMEAGYIKRPFLGVGTVYLDEETAKMYSIPSGMGVQKVVQGSAAYIAGIIPGDIIVEIDGKKVTGESDLTDIVNKKKVGDTISLKIVKENSNTKTVNVKLAENKSDQQ
ncbi:MAG: trypsin-like peptidase domain-containing protein, partial [Clostridium sp.]